MPADSSCKSNRTSISPAEAITNQIRRSKSSKIKRHCNYSEVDLRWDAINKLVDENEKKTIGIDDFRVLRRVGAGDMGNVFSCCLKAADHDLQGLVFAMKVVDKEDLKRRGKVRRVEVEKEVLKMLDHPFLPTLYAEFEASHYCCFLMEFCSGGDLHSLRCTQKDAKFSLTAARFYAAEVLVALEYLHMLGIIYRDLKPENVLIRSNGHIMLSDFDLCLIGDSHPSIQPLIIRSNPMLPFACLPSFMTTCMTSSPTANGFGSVPGMFTAEPAETRSSSFVGTHEYVSPEVASGEMHGSAVDWWSFGIFLYEIIYGKTPFSGANSRESLKNIIRKPLSFPPGLDISSPEYSMECAVRSLITGLLKKDPERRLGSKYGAAEIKSHGFFKGLNFAIIRSMNPPDHVVSSVLRRPGETDMQKPAKMEFF